LLSARTSLGASSYRLALTGLTVAVALTAAVAFGWSTALMHHSASGAPADAPGLRSLLLHVVRQWRWLIGMAASLTGLVLHAVALHLGSLAVVQPLVVTGLVFSFLFRAALDRQLPSRRMMLWVALTAVGLTVFLVMGGSPSGGGGVSTTGTVLMLCIGAAVVGAAWAAASRAPRHAGLLLGSAAGVVFGLIAGTLKATTDVASRGLLPLFTSWPAYVLAVLGATGFVLNQRSYQKAPLSRSLPVANTLNPLVAVIFGVVGFGERPPGAAGAVTAEALGLAATLIGVFLLARSEEVTEES
jgi:drug/metabolite transporter (DMT)-like permease